MAVGINAMPVTFAAHVVAVIAAIMVLVWSISYRGGLAWEAENKNLIFNVCFFDLLTLTSSLFQFYLFSLSSFVQSRVCVDFICLWDLSDWWVDLTNPIDPSSESIFFFYNQ